MRVAPFAPTRQKGTLDYRDTLCGSIWGTLGRGTGFGKLRFAKGNFGDTRRIAGTYQRRALSKDPKRYDNQYKLRHPVIAMRSYTPTYSNTEIQAENRAKFAAANVFWQSLTDTEKELYNERGNKRNLSGHQLAISEFMKYYDEAEV